MSELKVVNIYDTNKLTVFSQGTEAMVICESISVSVITGSKVLFSAWCNRAIFEIWVIYRGLGM